MNFFYEPSTVVRYLTNVGIFLLLEFVFLVISCGNYKWVVHYLLWHVLFLKWISYGIQRLPILKILSLNWDQFTKHFGHAVSCRCRYLPKETLHAQQIHLCSWTAIWCKAKGAGPQRFAHSKIIRDDYSVWLTRNSNIVTLVYVQWQGISRPFSKKYKIQILYLILWVKN